MKRMAIAMAAMCALTAPAAHDSFPADPHRAQYETRDFWMSALVGSNLVTFEPEYGGFFVQDDWTPGGFPFVESYYVFQYVPEPRDGVRTIGSVMLETFAASEPLPPFTSDALPVRPFDAAAFAVRNFTLYYEQYVDGQMVYFDYVSVIVDGWRSGR